MGPHLGLHTQGGEVCGCLWWETSVCDMGVRRGWGRKKWASSHLLRYTAPQCLLFLLEVSHVICAATYCQHERIYTVRRQCIACQLWGNVYVVSACAITVTNVSQMDFCKYRKKKNIFLLCSSCRVQLMITKVWISHKTDSLLILRPRTILANLILAWIHFAQAV